MGDTHTLGVLGKAEQGADESGGRHPDVQEGAEGGRPERVGGPMVDKLDPLTGIVLV